MAVYRQNFSMLSSDSSEYGESFWENKLIYLRPNCSWTKPFRKMAVLTSVSLTYSQEQQEGAHGVLTAVTDDEQEIVLASLFPRNPTQNTRLVWRSDQDLRFTNTGDNSLTLSILTKERVNSQMISLGDNPFAAPIIPSFRTFKISITSDSQPGVDGTEEFVTTLKAIHSVHPPPPVKIPPRAEFFDFATVSEFELQFPFARDPQYQNIRNFMVAIYRIFSGRYLPFTLCRRNIKAPAHVTLQIWRFLNKYGLINSSIDPRTKPEAMVPTFDRWPQLVYTPNERLFTRAQYERCLRPPPSPTTTPLPQLYMLSCPSVDGSGGAEVPGLMSFGQWTEQEMNALEEGLRLDQMCESWDTLTRKVGSRQKEEVAAQVAGLPYSFYSFEQPAAVLRNPGGGQHGELPSGATVMKEMALSEHPEMRVVVRAVRAVGSVAARQILRGECVDRPGNAEQAAGILAMEKIAANAKKMRQLHKERILKCMAKMVDIVKQSVMAKKAAIEEANRVGFDAPNPSESEMSSDERTWSSGLEDALND